MTNFKIIFIHQVEDIHNDNIDINIILPDSTVYFGTLFTLQNIQKLMTINSDIYFWSTDMVIVKDLRKESIYNAINKIIEDGYMDSAFTNIGTVETVYSNFKSFDDIEQ